ncbi:MAG: uL13 family ribosomal protein, partial [Sulfurovum sp.]|nr:uL13 family ribosomal protein [Sulfurovaceae bacterium]
EHILSRLRENCMVDKCVRKDSSSCDPSRITRDLAVRGMLPKTTLGRHMLKKLKVYSGSEHPHTAQLNKGN